MFAAAISLAFENTSQAYLYLSFAMLIRIGFECVLMPSELLDLTVGDVLLSDRWDLPALF